MNLLVWGITLSTVGKLVLGIAVLRVHRYIIREHKIDKVVIRALQREQVVTFLGLALIVIGFILEMFFYNGFMGFFGCTGMECAGLLQAAFSA